MLSIKARTRVYVTSVAAVAVVIAALLALRAPEIPAAAWTGVVVLTALAVAADMLSFVLPQSARGSIAFIPFFALAVISPSWVTVAAIAVVRLLTEIASRREFTKAIFNVSQQALAVGATILLYVELGGTSLLTLANVSSLSILTHQTGLSALAAFAFGLFVNTLVVAGVIAIDRGKSVWRVWFQNTGSMIVLDLVTAPLVLFFAWVYVAFGWLAAATLWVPILGLRQVHKSNIELKRTNEELLQLMVKSLEARDPYTSGHSRRVQQYATIIARAAGLKEREIQQVGHAALLHDVGKIHEKYAQVLAKTERLSQSEWTLIQEHPVDGANLVSTMTRLREVVPAIRGHHENWDGTGYPDGLAGELIPIAARIIRFADTIDAMTTQRPYRAPLSESEVRAELVKHRGSQFDPEITERWLASPLWATLFAPTNPVSIADRARLEVVSTSSKRAKPSPALAKEA
jgi:putative nucleotidyltransferase with HDIG domain